MARLTNDHRSAILKELLTHAFGTKAQAQYTAEGEYVDRLHTIVIGDDLPKLKNVPERWLSRDGFYRVVMGSVGHHSFSTSSGIFGFSTALQLAGVKAAPQKMFFTPGSYSTPIATLDDDHPLVVEFRALRDKRSALEEDILTSKHQIEAVINSTFSDTKLIEIWPEAKAIIEKVMGKTQAQIKLPAVQLGALNAILDLPPEKTSA